MLSRQKVNLLYGLFCRGIGIKIIEAIDRTKRELFTPREFYDLAYEDMPFPIGYGAIIREPYAVAKMAGLLDIISGDRILEIGTGSGYNAAIMAHLAGKSGKVVSLEIDNRLAGLARVNLKRAGVKNVCVLNSKGMAGCPDMAPFDKIIVTTSMASVPDGLLSQLKMGGIMVLPLKAGASDFITRVIKRIELLISAHGDYGSIPVTHG